MNSGKLVGFHLTPPNMVGNEITVNGERFIKVVEGGGWRPIHTAPRDGTPILLHRAPGEWPFVGYWGNPYRYNKDGKKNAWIGHEQGLHEDSDWLVWQPLPDGHR